MHIKRMLIVCAAILLSGSLAFALTYTSPSYTLKNARIVVSGGKASSSNYSLNEATIANIIGASAKSANYSLNTDLADRRIRPFPPTLNPVASPTRISPQTLSGTKQKGTSVYINGYLAVPLNNEITWSYEASLAEGENCLIITSRNECSLESESVYANIILDTVAPVIIIDPPLDGTIVSRSLITVSGTQDGVSFTREESLALRLNSITIEAVDEAGNVSFKSIEVYRLRESITIPE